MKDQRLFLIGAILITILLIGSFGYHIVQPDYSILDSVYMTVITISTIGYGEVKPLTQAGKLFNIGLIAIGWVGIFMVARMTGQMLIEGEIVKYFGRRKMDKQLAAISGHYIVCGYGRVGRVVCDEFSRHKVPFVLIEKNEDAMNEIRARNYIFIQGDCTDDGVLISAGIKRARGFMNTIPDNADAVYAILTARQHNPELFIMARADSASAEKMLVRAGADRVISPHAAAGTRMALAALRPNLVDFISLAAVGETEGIRVEELRVPEGSGVDGKTFKETDIRARYGLNVIGVKKPDGKLMFNPAADYAITAGDTLIIVGSSDQLSKIDQLLEKAN
jgi:voltage-gated potassium channel